MSSETHDSPLSWTVVFASRIVLNAVGVLLLRLPSGRFRMYLVDKTIRVDRRYGIPAWSKPTQTITARRVRHRARSRQQSTPLTLETLGKRVHLNVGERVAVLIQHNTRDGVHQHQTENEGVPQFAGGELDDCRRAANTVRAVVDPLIAVLHGPQHIAAGRQIAEGKAAIRVRPGNRILWLRLHGRKRDNCAAQRGVAAGAEDHSSDCARWGCLRQRANHQSTEK